MEIHDFYVFLTPASKRNITTGTKVSKVREWFLYYAINKTQSTTCTHDRRIIPFDSDILTKFYDKNLPIYRLQVKFK